MPAPSTSSERRCLPLRGQLTPAPGLPYPTLARRFDIDNYKKAIAAWTPGGVGLMYAYSVKGDFGSAAASTFFAGSDVPNGDFELLCLTPWLSGPASPASGPAGLGMTDPVQLAATVTMLRLNATVLSQAVPGGILGGLAKVAASGAYADLAVLPAAADILAAGMAAFLASLPTVQPAPGRAVDERWRSADLSGSGFVIA